MDGLTRRSRSGRRAAAGVALALAGLALVSMPAAVAATSTPGHGRISRGDVVAAFQARTTGGYVNLLDGRTIAAPVRGLNDGRISPFRSASYCALDWHYLGISYLAPGGHRAALVLLRQLSAAFAIDGSAVPVTMRTPAKRFVDGTQGDFGMSVGVLIPPGSLSSGWHTLTTTFGGPAGDSEITVGFEILDGPC